jgi:hypothetical protein
MKGNNNSVNKIAMPSESMEENSFSDFSFSHPLSLLLFFIAFALKQLIGGLGLGWMRKWRESVKVEKIRAEVLEHRRIEESWGNCRSETKDRSCQWF